MTEIVLSLDEKEDEAYRYFLNAQENWRNFIRVALEIKASKEWQVKSKTWGAYCEQYMPVSATRIRQFKVADETAAMIESITTVTPNEYQLRMLKSAVPETDRHLLAETFSRANAATQTPTKKDYKATYEVLKVRERSGGYVSVDGEAKIVDITQVAVDEAVIEAAKRQNQHIHDNAKNESQEITCKVGTISLLLQRDFGMSVADDVTLYVTGKTIKIYRSAA